LPYPKNFLVLEPVWFVLAVKAYFIDYIVHIEQDYPLLGKDLDHMLVVKHLAS
jgi:hypothetical protein